MLKESLTYTNFNDEEVTEDFYFNLTKAELSTMDLTTAGGLAERLNRIVAAKDTPEIIKMFQEILLTAYGEKSDDGKYFNKSKEISEKFSHTQAYSDLFMKLATDEEYANKFIESILPKDMREEIEKAKKEEKNKK